LNPSSQSLGIIIPFSDKGRTIIIAHIEHRQHDHLQQENNTDRRWLEERHIFLCMTSNKSTTGQRRLVLTEEDYTSTLSSIVQRDYFPQIAHLERQHELLQARESGNIAAAVAVRRDTRRWMEEEEAKELQRKRDEHDVVTEPEGRIVKRGNGDVLPLGIRKCPRPLQEETLTGFHARVTNEDDQEFDLYLKQEIQANRQRLEGLFQSSTKSNPPIHNNLNLLEMASDDFAPESNRIAASEWTAPSMKNGLFFNPTPLRGASQQEAATTTKLLTNGELTSSDQMSSAGLMLPPSKSQTQGLLQSKSFSSKKPGEVASAISASSSSKQSTINKSQLVEYIPKHRLEKKIDPSQTRFPNSKSIIPVPGQAMIARPASRRQYNDGLLDASDTDSYFSSTDDVSYYSTDLDAPLRSLEQERTRRLKRMQTQQAQQYRSYVAMTPQIVPGMDGNQSPITTWGTIEDTPLVLSGREFEQHTSNDDSTSSFRVAEESHREHHARRAEMELERRSKRAKQTSTKARTTKATPSLTPAAMSLLQKTQRLSSRSRDAFGSALRSSYTASRQRPSSSTNSKLRAHKQKRLKRDNAFNATPQV
jgi:protein DGCR14